MPGQVPPAERLARIRVLRAMLPKGKFKASEIDALKRAPLKAFPRLTRKFVAA